METTDGGFIAYPTNRVAGTITDTDEAKRAVEDLVAAGFDREDIDVLHGKQDLRRLDPAGAEHGLFAKLQRSLVRGAVGLEFKHLTHHVEDLEAGRFVVMVLARERGSRDVAAEILHTHGAEFVGFYGRWAYESLPHDDRLARDSVGTTYNISAGPDVIRLRLQGDERPWSVQPRIRSWQLRYVLTAGSFHGAETIQRSFMQLISRPASPTPA